MCGVGWWWWWRWGGIGVEYGYRWVWNATPALAGEVGVDAGVEKEVDDIEVLAAARLVQDVCVRGVLCESQYVQGLVEAPFQSITHTYKATHVVQRRRALLVLRVEALGVLAHAAPALRLCRLLLLRHRHRRRIGPRLLLLRFRRRGVFRRSGRGCRRRRRVGLGAEEPGHELVWVV